MLMRAVSLVPVIVVITSGDAFRFNVIHTRIPPDSTLQRRGMSSTIHMSSAAKVLDIQYGDTGGAALVVEDTMISRGPADILSDVNWRVMPNERWAIVGPNGAGKSTLLSALVGKIPVRSGSVRVKKGLRVGYLEQTAVAGANTTVKAEVMSRMDRVVAASTALAAAQAALVAAGGAPGTGVANGDSLEARAALDAYVAAQYAFEDAGGNTVEKRVAEVLQVRVSRQHISLAWL